MGAVYGFSSTPYKVGFLYLSIPTRFMFSLEIVIPIGLVIIVGDRTFRLYCGRRVLDNYVSLFLDLRTITCYWARRVFLILYYRCSAIFLSYAPRVRMLLAFY